MSLLAPTVWRRPSRHWVLAFVVFLAASCSEAGQDSFPAQEAGNPPFTVRGRWQDPAQLRYHVDPGEGVLSSEMFRVTIERALAIWSASGPVGFAAAADLSSADVVFRWGVSASKAHPDGLFGRDTSVAKTGAVGPGCTVWFDSEQSWQEGGGSGPVFYQAAVHEIGHVLGLGHSSDLESVMVAQRENGRLVLAASDRHGLQSLYGGGSEGLGDLVIERDGAHILRRVAPPASTDWTLFDSDGDGDLEIIVWTRASAREGALTIYHFGPGVLLSKTVGPVLGIAGYGAEIECTLEAGARCLDVFQPDGNVYRFRFDEHGFPGDRQPIPVRARRTPASGARSGDLDGDGVSESVRLQAG